MAPYVRPVFPSLVFRDAAGAVIDYGNRWHGGSPPEDAYSDEAHPERWAPVVRVADALVAHLVEEYDVAVTHDGPPDDGPFSTTAGIDALRRTRLTPTDPMAAPLEFVIDAHPAVHIRAGPTHMSGYPGCGCDACDDPLEQVVEDLEKHVFTVVSGRLREVYRQGWPVPGLQSAIWTSFDGGSERGKQPLEHVGYRDRRQLRRRLRPVRGGWAPWRLRKG